MISTLTHKGKTYRADLSKPIDISIPMVADERNVRAWYVPPVKIEPVKGDSWIGEVKQGGSVNFRNITFNPHGNGTHTECVGHISLEDYSINQCLREFFFVAELVTILPFELDNGDRVITAEMIKNCIDDKAPEALVIRTLPNQPEKMMVNYSNTNPPYLTVDAAEYIHQKNIRHLLIDLPSVDREQDEGKLAAHHIFWQYPQGPLLDRTITELIYVPNHILDGMYFLNLQIASFENDASPSKPVLFPMFLSS